MSKTKYASAIIITPDSRLLIHSVNGSYYAHDAESSLTIETYVNIGNNPAKEIEQEMQECLKICGLLHLRYSFNTTIKTKLGAEREVHLFFFDLHTTCTFGLDKPYTLDILTVNEAISEVEIGRLKLSGTGQTALKVAKNVFSNNLSN